MVLLENKRIFAKNVRDSSRVKCPSSHSQKIWYTFGKNPFVSKKTPLKMRKNLIALKKSRTLLLINEMPLRTLRGLDATTETPKNFQNDYEVEQVLNALANHQYELHNNLHLCFLCPCEHSKTKIFGAFPKDP